MFFLNHSKLYKKKDALSLLKSKMFPHIYYFHIMHEENKAQSVATSFPHNY